MCVTGSTVSGRYVNVLEEHFVVSMYVNVQKLEK